MGNTNRYPRAPQLKGDVQISNNLAKVLGLLGLPLPTGDPATFGQSILMLDELGLFWNLSNQIPNSMLDPQVVDPFDRLLLTVAGGIVYVQAPDDVNLNVVRF